MLPFGEPVVFIAAGSKPARASDGVVEDWSTPVAVLSASAGVEPLTTAEPSEVDRGSVQVGYRLYFGEVLTVSRLWRVRVRGEVLTVDGRSQPWRNPLTGWAAGTVVETRWLDG